MPDDGLTRRGCFVAAALVSTVRATAASAAGTGIVRLSLNENPFGPSALVRDAIFGQLRDIPRYVGEEAAALKSQIAAKEGVSPEQIILGEILDQLGLCLALEGPVEGEFLYSEPGYTALVDAVAPGGGKAIGVPLNASLENDLPGFEARMSSKTRALYLINPHNPSGTVTETETLKTFLRKTSRRITVIVDEAYLEFEPDFRQRSAIALVHEGADVIVFRTFTKIYGLAGLAIGYAVAPVKLATAFTRQGLGEPHGLNRFALAAASASLRDRAYVFDVRDKVTAERLLWHRMLDAIGYRRSDSRGNFVFFDTRRPHEAFSAAMAAEGVEIARAFPPLNTWARVSIAEAKGFRARPRPTAPRSRSTGCGRRVRHRSRLRSSHALRVHARSSSLRRAARRCLASRSRAGAARPRATLPSR